MDLIHTTKNGSGQLRTEGIPDSVLNFLSIFSLQNKGNNYEQQYYLAPETLWGSGPYTGKFPIHQQNFTSVQPTTGKLGGFILLLSQITFLVKFSFSLKN